MGSPNLKSAKPVEVIVYQTRADLKLSREQAKLPSPYWFNRKHPFRHQCAACERWTPPNMLGKGKRLVRGRRVGPVELVCEDCWAWLDHRRALAFANWCATHGLHRVEDDQDRHQPSPPHQVRQITVAELGEAGVDLQLPGVREYADDVEADRAGNAVFIDEIERLTGTRLTEDETEEDLCKLLNEIEPLLAKFYHLAGIEDPLAEVFYPDV